MGIVVGVSDMKVSNNELETITTYALGSCLGIAAYDPIYKVGGVLHSMLPLAKADPEKAQQKPAMYIDSGLALLLSNIYDLGGRKENLEISVAGGARMKKISRDDYFKIGKRNFITLRKLLWKNGFIISKQDVGGVHSRTMSLAISNGEITINKKVLNG